MAPKKAGNKRQAGGAAPAAKKAKKVDPIEHVLAAIEQAEDLSDSCRKMLRDSVPLSLGTPQNQRHEVQDVVVSMLGEVVTGVQAKLQATVDAENAKLGEVENRKVDLEAAVAAAEELLATAVKDVADKKEALKQAATATLSAQSVLKEKQDLQRSGDAVLVRAKESKVALEQGLQEHLHAIVEATDENPSQHYEALVPLLHELGLEQSLLTALPSVCSKKTIEERGSFGTMVLGSLGQSLRDRAATLAKLVDEATPAAQQRGAAVQGAQAEVDEASVAQAAATEALSAANAAQAAAKTGVQDAKNTLGSFQPEYTQATSLRDEEASKLDNFKLTSVASFETLRDAVTAEAGDA